MKRSDFETEQARAMERMREMSRRAAVSSNPHKMPPAPPFVKLTQSGTNEQYASEKTNTQQPFKEAPQNSEMGQKLHSSKGGLFGSRGITSILSDIGIPITGGLKGDSDMTLILGLLLILNSEKSDRFLLLALLYILI